MSTKQNNVSEKLSPWQFSVTAKGIRLWLLTFLVIPSWSVSFWLQCEVVRVDGITLVEGSMLLIAGVLTLWLWFAFWTALIGFVITLCKIDPLTLKTRVCLDGKKLHLAKRYAVVMPVYNEETRRIMVGFESCLREIARSDFRHHFDFYLLSDTQDPALAEAELRAWQRLQKRTKNLGVRSFYRRRTCNTGKKVGNLADFCQRWGAGFEGMIVLDADSLMTVDAMVRLAVRLEANPCTGLIQTVPMPARQKSIFGRFVQFAAHLYTPMLANGLSFWQTDNANYWGHNAIIRISPFMQHAGLPDLPGYKPFGGPILSHDFVEAALLKRAGWACFLVTDDEGSYEEVPSNLMDYVQRDRRWLQGNLQHLGLLTTKGLTTVSRMHFLFGAFAYLSSPLLMMLLMLGNLDAILKVSVPHTYFTPENPLFVNWPVDTSMFMHAGLGITFSLLLMPKLLAVILACWQRSAAFGGRLKLLGNSLLEMALAIVIAPVMLYYHCVFVLTNLCGYSVKWEAQVRSGRAISLKSAVTLCSSLVFLGSGWLCILTLSCPSLLFWLLPVVGGLIVSPFLVSATSESAQWFFCRLDVVPPRVFKCLHIGLGCYAEGHYEAKIPEVPDVDWRPMIIQDLRQPAFGLLPDEVPTGV